MKFTGISLLSRVNFMGLMEMITNVLIVCTANICRSPVAEALLRHRLEKKGLKDWNVRSAGTWASSGQGASAYSVEILAEQGFDISEHVSKPINDQLLKESDLILCMELGQVEALKAEFPHEASRIYSLSEMSGDPYSVYDPYGEPRSSYEKMVAEMTRLIEDGLPRIIRLARTNREKRAAREGR